MTNPISNIGAPLAVSVVDAFGNAGTVNPFSLPRVAPPSTRFMVETFDTGFDPVQWTASAGGTGVSPTTGVGGSNLVGGTTLNSFSKLAGIPIAPLFKPGLTEIDVSILLSPAVPTGSYFFFGQGTSSASPTIAAPLIQAMGWEISTAGVLAPVAYGTGTRFSLPFINRGALPTDGGGHHYYTYVRGDQCFWCIDNPDNVVASGSIGPDVNTLPILFQVISNAGVAGTLTALAAVISDGGKGSVALADGTYPWRRQTVYPSAASFSAQVNAEGQRSTYRYAVQAFAPVATPTAFLVIAGSATKVIRVKRIKIGGVATANGNLQVQASRWSTAGTPGSAVLTALTAVKHDTGDATATAVVSTVGTANYTTQGTGSTVPFAADRIFLATTATGATQQLVYDFSTRQDKAFILRGATDILALSGAGSAVPAGGVLDIEIETEEDSF